MTWSGTSVDLTELPTPELTSFANCYSLPIIQLPLQWIQILQLGASCSSVIRLKKSSRRAACCLQALGNNYLSSLTTVSFTSFSVSTGKEDWCCVDHKIIQSDTVKLNSLEYYMKKINLGFSSILYHCFFPQVCECVWKISTII